MRDYAKKDSSVPKREKQIEENPVIAFFACCFMGAFLGGLLGYGLLFTG
jgi:hypothetical protein